MEIDERKKVTPFLNGCVQAIPGASLNFYKFSDNPLDCLIGLVVKTVWNERCRDFEARR